MKFDRLWLTFFKRCAIGDYMAYFDNAATSFPKPESVYSFMDSFYRTCDGSYGRGKNGLGALVKETRFLLQNQRDSGTTSPKTAVSTSYSSKKLKIHLQKTVSWKKQIGLSSNLSRML